MKKIARTGTSLIDLIISIAIIALLFGGVYLVYFSIVTSISNIGARNAAADVIGKEIETIHNMPYDSVGTVGGIPSGAIPQTQSVTSGKYTFTVSTDVRNIDDPFDGTIATTPKDTAPADYKLVAISAACPLCPNFFPVTITTTVAPRGLESASQNGSLFISVLNANGAGVPGATIQVVNNSVAPSINLTDTTNASGVLQLVGVPTSTQHYHVTASGSGYSSDQTYTPGSLGGSSPITPDATVAAQTVTSLTLAIDRTSALTVNTSDNRCQALGNKSFTISGTKLIGQNPSILKFSTTTTTSATGTKIFPSMEWDTYSLVSNDAATDVVGTIPRNPIVINPATPVSFRFILQPAAEPALLVSVVDAATGADVPEATVTLSRPSFSQSLLTSHATFTETDWSAGNYSFKDAQINTATAGSLSLLANASGSYPTGTLFALTSNTFNMGGPNSRFNQLTWNPASVPANTVLEFQLAANNDNATWNYIGPDGTPGTYFTATPTALPAALSGNQYLRYKVYLSTDDGTVTPQLNDVSMDFSGNCVPPSQVLFSSLPQQTFTLDVTSANYFEATTSVTIAPGFQSVAVPLTHR